MPLLVESTAAMAALAHTTPATGLGGHEFHDVAVNTEYYIVPVRKGAEVTPQHEDHIYKVKAEDFVKFPHSSGFKAAYHHRKTHDLPNWPKEKYGLLTHISSMQDHIGLDLGTEISNENGYPVTLVHPLSLPLYYKETTGEWVVAVPRYPTELGGRNFHIVIPPAEAVPYLTKTKLPDPLLIFGPEGPPTDLKKKSATWRKRNHGEKRAEKLANNPPAALISHKGKNFLLADLVEYTIGSHKDTVKAAQDPKSLYHLASNVEFMSYPTTVTYQGREYALYHHGDAEHPWLIVVPGEAQQNNKYISIALSQMRMPDGMVPTARDLKPMKFYMFEDGTQSAHIKLDNAVGENRSIAVRKSFDVVKFRMGDIFHWLHVVKKEGNDGLFVRVPTGMYKGQLHELRLGKKHNGKIDPLHVGYAPLMLDAHRANGLFAMAAHPHNIFRKASDTSVKKFNTYDHSERLPVTSQIGTIWLERVPDIGHFDGEERLIFHHQQGSKGATEWLLLHEKGLWNEPDVRPFTLAHTALDPKPDGGKPKDVPYWTIPSGHEVAVSEPRMKYTAMYDVIAFIAIDGETYEHVVFTKDGKYYVRVPDIYPSKGELHELMLTEEMKKHIAAAPFPHARKVKLHGDPSNIFSHATANDVRTNDIRRHKEVPDEAYPKTHENEYVANAEVEEVGDGKVEPPPSHQTTTEGVVAKAPDNNLHTPSISLPQNSTVLTHPVDGGGKVEPPNVEAPPPQSGGVVKVQTDGRPHRPAILRVPTTRRLTRTRLGQDHGRHNTRLQPGLYNWTQPLTHPLQRTILAAGRR